MPEIKLEPVPFDEAIEYFRTRVAMTPDEYDQLIGEARSRAFTISDITSLDVIRDILAELRKAVEEGITMQEFKAGANEILERKGWKGLSSYRLENIFRTNIQSVFSAGRYKRQTSPAVLQERPYWQYSAVRDQRTRPTHRALHGKVYPADHPFWDTWYPPNGYQCRCTVIARSERDIRRLGLTVEERVPNLVEPPGGAAIPLVPDPGFANNPGKDAWQPDLNKYPESLRRAYEERQLQRNL